MSFQIAQTNNNNALIKVLVVDDSALVRSLLGEIIRSAPDMYLVGAAPTPMWHAIWLISMRPM